MTRALIIENDERWKDLYSRALSSQHEMTFCAHEDDAAGRLLREAYGIIILSHQPARQSDVASLQKLRGAAPHTPIIITSEIEKAELIVAAIKAGAIDFVVKPCPPDRLRLAVENAIENRSLKDEIDYLRRQQDIIYDFDKIIAVSPAMKTVIATVRKLAATDSTLLMTGETGTGKSLISGAIHFNSPRRSRPFTKINCANIPEPLLESELFGHGKGAFTGASKARIGRIEQANGGTVFLDEIGELTPALQAKLLRVLEEKSFERLGENRTIHSDIRIIAATNRNLEQLMEMGAFRADLYYRINVLRVHLPPLRERKECIEPFAHYLLGKICRSVKKQVEGFTLEVMGLFKQYSWPGNIRQLSNTIERAVLLTDGHIIGKDSVSLPQNGRHNREEDRKDDLQLNGREKDFILEALGKSLWIQKDAAALLGISPRVLHYKIKKYGITHPRWYKNN